MTSGFYVYQLRLANSESPFYIGKGRGRRILEHFRPSVLKKRSHKNNVINKAIHEGVEGNKKDRNHKGAHVGIKNRKTKIN